MLRVSRIVSAATARYGSGAPVRAHAEFCEYLRAKARPGEIELARLPFEGKNTVVYSAFDANGGEGIQRSAVAEERTFDARARFRGVSFTRHNYLLKKYRVQ